VAACPSDNDRATALGRPYSARDTLTPALSLGEGEGAGYARSRTASPVFMDSLAARTTASDFTASA